MASSNDTATADLTARTLTPATSSTILSPPSDTAAATDCTETRPTTRTRPDQAGPSAPVGEKGSSRVLVLTLEEGSKVNPFQISQALSKFGNNTDVYRPSNTKLEVTMSTEKETDRLLAAKSLSFPGEGNTLVSVPMVVTLHPTKNSAFGVITCRELADSTEADVLGGLKEQGVTNVRRMKKKVNGEPVPTDTFVLTFSSKELPPTVRVGWLSVRVRVYVPDPTRCYRCHQYGHVAKACKRQETCGRCSVVGHSSGACDANVPKCTACGGEHEAWSRKCPTFLSKRESLKNKALGKSPTESTPQAGSHGKASGSQDPTVVGTVHTRSSSYRDAVLREPGQAQPSVSLNSRMGHALIGS